MGVEGQHHAPARFAPREDPVPIAQEAGWAPGPVWMGAENLASQLWFDPWTVQPLANSYTDWAVPVVFDLKGVNVISIYRIAVPVLLDKWEQWLTHPMPSII